MFLRHALLTSALSLVVILANPMPGKTQSVSSSCTLTQATRSGILVAIGTPLPTKLVSTSLDGGTPAQLAITCTQPATLQVSAPIQGSGPSFTPASSLAEVTASTGGQTNSATPGQSLSIPQNTTTTLSVDMVVDRGSTLLLSGTYGYNVTLSIMP
jgi:hypothetical protein